MWFLSSPSTQFCLMVDWPKQQVHWNKWKAETKWAGVRCSKARVCKYFLVNIRRTGWLVSMWSQIQLSRVEPILNLSYYGATRKFGTFTAQRRQSSRRFSEMRPEISYKCCMIPCRSGKDRLVLFFAAYLGSPEAQMHMILKIQLSGRK